VGAATAEAFVLFVEVNGGSGVTLKSWPLHADGL
jgi:hypothetical protein